MIKIGGLLLFLAGYLIGTNLIIHPNTDRKEKETATLTGNTKKTGNAEKKLKTIRIRKEMKKYIGIRNDNTEEIKPENISINVRTEQKERNKSSPEPNFIALTTLWAHYIAGQLGLIEAQTPPWDYREDNTLNDIDEKKLNLDLSNANWVKFLKKMIKNNKWVNWINDPEVMKGKTLLALQS